MVVQSRKRSVVRSFVLACVLAYVLGITALHTAAAQVVIPNPCKGLTPSDFEYWMYSCWAYDAIAALVSPFVNGHSGFLVR
jgi:hypothetical protein